MTDFTVRDLTWRSLATAKPSAGQACTVRAAEAEFDAQFAVSSALGPYWLTRWGSRLSAYPEDLWRPEDER